MQLFGLRLAAPRRFALALALCGLAASAYGQAPAEIRRNVYTTERLSTEAPRIDGRLGDAAWARGAWFDQWTQAQPREGAAPSERTAFNIQYDDDYLYIAIRAYDSQPERISRQVARRDVFAGDMVGVAFDSYHDLRTAYEFNMSAAGAKVDLIIKGVREFDTTWNAVWDGATAQEDSAWTAEMRVPLSQLRYSDRDEQVWGLHLWRWLHRLEEESQFQMIPRDAVGMVYHFGELHGIRGLERKRRIELMPYTLARAATFEPEPGNPFADGSRSNAGFGLDARLGLTSAFTLDMAFNPDFGQVEADPSVMNLTAFETFYQEKRPFFLEGSNLFEFNFEGSDAFYSRRIGAAPRYRLPTAAGEYAREPEITTILGAAKLTGKTTSGLSVGILESLTSRESAELAAPAGRRRSAVEPLTNYFVGRAEQEYDRGNTVVGGLVTAVHRDLSESHLQFLNRAAYSGGLNFRHYWGGRTYFIDGMAVGSTIQGTPEAILRAQRSSARYYQRPDAGYLGVDSSRTRLSGSGASLEIGKAGNSRLRYSFDLSYISPGLDFNDAGYMARADRINADVRTRYVVNEPTRWFRSYSARLDFSQDWTWGGEAIRTSGMLLGGGQLKNFWSVDAALRREREALGTRLLRGGPAIRMPGFSSVFGGVSTDGRKSVEASLGGSYARFDDGRGRETSLDPSVSWRVNTAMTLSLNLGYERNHDEWQYVARAAHAGEDRYVLGALRQRTLRTVLRSSYSLRPDLAIQLYAQPFFSSGRYSRFKVVTDPRAGAYADRFRLFEGAAVQPDGSGRYGLDETGDGAADYTIGNPDFNFREFRSNLVLRWEYRPGSTLFVVWAQSRSGSDDAAYLSTRPDAYRIGDELERLYDLYPYNVFAIKLTHHFSVD